MTKTDAVALARVVVDTMERYFANPYGSEFMGRPFDDTTAELARALLELQAELARVMPVYEAACAWVNWEGTVAVGSLVNPELTLRQAINRARTAKEST